MAEAVVTLVSNQIKPLGDLIVQEAKFLCGVGDQVELAQNELHLMGAFLKDADSRAGDDGVVRNCVKLIRDVAYDLEDAVESFTLKVVLKRRGGLKRFVCILSEGVDCYRIGSEIQGIMNKLSALRSSLQSYNIRQSDPERASASKIQKQRDQRQTYAHETEPHLVGLEESTKVLVDELVREEKRHRVVSIWGMGGSGKTTLAKQVLVQEDVKRHFARFAWTCISQPCDGRAALEDILIKLTSPTEDEKKQIKKMEKEEIAKKLCSIQREERCLVILDDIWTREAWHSLKAGFPVNEETESRMLLTTRKKEVALHASTNDDFLHEPKLLDKKQSLELFEKIAFCGSNNTELEINAKKELGEKMLEHCSGHPLAIRVLASLLRRRETIEEWETVLRSVNAYIMRGTNFLERENTGQEYGVSSVLTLSYDDLPSHLKLCFMYLAQYPEDHEIPVKRLMQLWIAEGFIASTSEIYGSVEIIEDVAYDCLIELVERSMVQVGERGSTQKVKTCRLHDLMRDLCLQKAKEESFLDVVDFSVGLQVSNAIPTGKVRRLALYLDRKSKCEFSPWDGRNDHIRSLLYFYRIDKCSKRVIRSVFNDFKLLRVLKFENICEEFELPKTIGKLVHLRFLSLKGSCFFGALPSSVCNLMLLQTLDLRADIVWLTIIMRGYNEGGIKIRNDCLQMEQLRHLYLPVLYTVPGGQKLSFAKLCNLQSLVNVDIDKCNLNDLVRLTNLKKLGINAWQSSKLEEFNMMLMSESITYEHLRSLSLRADTTYPSSVIIPMDMVLRCPHLCKLHVVGKITKLPKELQDYQNLSKLTLIDTKLKGEEIEILEQLPRLRTLFLGINSIESDTLIFSQKGFPCLEFLTLRGLERLNQWRVEKGAMPRLHRLRIKDCRDLREIPDGLQYVTALKELSIDGMPSRFCRRVGEGGEDFYKIKHVPSLTITHINISCMAPFSTTSSCI